jgi:hypothetical protein
MKKNWKWMMVLAATLCWALTGCGDNGDEENGDFTPAVDVNGTWDVRMDGDPLGVMVLQVSKGGIVKGTLTTTRDAVAQLSGNLDDYVAEFTVTFPTEAYLATLTFNKDAGGASGVLLDNKGFKRVLSLTPRFGE